MPCFPFERPRRVDTAGRCGKKLQGAWRRALLVASGSCSTARSRPGKTVSQAKVIYVNSKRPNESCAREQAALGIRQREEGGFMRSWDREPGGSRSYLVVPSPSAGAAGPNGYVTLASQGCQPHVHTRKFQLILSVSEETFTIHLQYVPGVLTYVPIGWNTCTV